MNTPSAKPPPMHLDVTVLPGGERRDLFVVDGRIEFEPVEDAVTVSTGGYAIPGLVDAHAHLALASPAGPDASEDERLRASARAQLDAGVLFVREPGSPTRAARDLSGDDVPRIHTAGRFVAAVGGYFPGLAREVTPDRLAEAVAEEAAWSGHWAKVVGDFFDGTGTLVPSFPTTAIREAAAAVHAAGGRITMHCMTIPAAESAIEAGFDAIEHGMAMTADLIEEMARRGMIWVPTISIVEPIRELIAEDPSIDGPPILAGLDAHAGMVRLGAERGVRVLAGTDAGMVPHGLVATEIRLLEAAGLPTGKALAAGSWEARRHLGLPLIEEGAPADLVVYPDDPSGDLTVLEHPSLVMLGGRVVREA